MTGQQQINNQIVAELSSRLIQKFENRKNDLTKDPITADEFFDDLEQRAEEIDPIFAHIINFYAVTLYGTMPTNNNPFLEI